MGKCTVQFSYKRMCKGGGEPCWSGDFNARRGEGSYTHEIKEEEGEETSAILTKRGNTLLASAFKLTSRHGIPAM